MMHRARCLLAGIGALLAFAGDGLAQTRLLAGVVKDSLGTPIVAAAVTAGAEGTRTDSAGTFVLVLPRTDSVTVAIRRLGYEQVIFSLSVDEAEGNTIEVVLNQIAQSLNPVAVEAIEARAMTLLRNFDERRSMGLGQFIVREQIEQRNASQVAQLLQNQRGIIVYPTLSGFTPIKFSRYQSRDCQPAIFVDGQHAPGIDINTVHPADLEGVEMYSTLGTVPTDFGRLSDNRFCGVIALWTKRPLVEQSKEKKDP